MGFDFSKVKRKSAGENVTDMARNSSPCCNAYDEFVKANGNGRWAWTFYYYFLHKLIEKLQGKVDQTEAFWETEAWKKAAALVDKEPDDIIVGLKNVEALYAEYYFFEIENVRAAIRTLTGIRNLSEGRTEVKIFSSPSL